MTWKDSEVWKRMVDGEDCEMCGDIHLDENRHSFLVAELPFSYVRLPRNQYWRGWAVVAFKRHATELFDLSDEERDAFFREVSSVAQVVKKVFNAVKINYAIFGNLCPHLHCHIFPQRRENDPHAPINPDAE